MTALIRRSLVVGGGLQKKLWEPHFAFRSFLFPTSFALKYGKGYSYETSVTCCLRTQDGHRPTLTLTWEKNCFEIVQNRYLSSIRSNKLNMNRRSPDHHKADQWLLSGHRILGSDLGVSLCLFHFLAKQTHQVFSMVFVQASEFVFLPPWPTDELHGRGRFCWRNWWICDSRTRFPSLLSAKESIYMRPSQPMLAW